MWTYASHRRFVGNSAKRASDHDRSQNAAASHALTHGVSPALVARHERSTPRFFRSFLRGRKFHEDLGRHQHHMTTRQPRREKDHRPLAERRSGFGDIQRRFHRTRSHMQRSWKKMAVALPQRDEREVRRIPQFDRSPTTHVMTVRACRACRHSGRDSTRHRPIPRKPCKPRSSDRCDRAAA